MSSLEVSREDDVLVATINRPEKRNAINAEVASGLEEFVKELDGDEDLRVGIVSGSGGFFSSGMDLKAFSAGETPTTEEGGFAGIAERPPRKVTIAAVEGFALAGGFEIALACDILVCAAGAQLGLPESTRGIVAGAGGLVRLPRLVPSNVAIEMVATGQPITAERGFELGLVNQVAEPGQALKTAKDMARQIASNAPLAVTISKRVIVEQSDWSQRELWQHQAELIGPVYTSEDAAEGALAFVEKRDPVWTGR